MSQELLVCSGLTKRFGRKEALKDVSIRLESGKIIGLLGPNGSGKTTLIKLINGLAPARQRNDTYRRSWAWSFQQIHDFLSSGSDVFCRLDAGKGYGKNVWRFLSGFSEVKQL